MKENLEARSRLALACYARAAAVMAQRAGVSLPLAPDEYGPMIAQAQRLALPEQTRAESEPPVLTSLVGHLYGQRAQGYYRPRPLAGDADTVMPKADRPSDLAASYRALWGQMAAAREQLLAHAAGAPIVQEAGYHALLQRFAWSMPAPSVGDSDVSLFDFARVSAALAVCLEAGQAGDDVALLIGGDVSGVQDWLYTIGSSGAAKSLRGRSVYLQLLSEIIALYVLDELELPSCNLLYVGGGNFYVLAPRSAAEQLSDLQRDISARLLAMHDGALYLALGCTPVTSAELLAGASGDAWGRVNRAVNARKRQRFSELDDARMAAVVGAALPGTGRLEDTCAICRRPIVKGERAMQPDEDDPAHNCELCESFSQLGRLLPDAEFLVVAKLAGDLTFTGRRINNWQDGLRAFGYDVQFLEHAQTAPRSWSAQAGSERELVRVYYWREEGVQTFPGNPDLRTTVWIYRPLAQAAPRRKGEAKLRIVTFDDLKTEGIRRWGVLRMDVDNLGRIFQEGLTEGSPSGGSLSRVVGLSAQLRLLFESHVPLLLEQYNADHPESTYLMYAGGDDLFVVAGWSHLPELAAQIRAALVEFACHNPRVTISGGISLALDENYPLYQAARAAGRAEDMAKDAGKNRLAFLGQAVPWESEDEPGLDRIRYRVAQLRRWLNGNHGLPKAFLMKLLALNEEWNAWKKSEKSNHARYRHSQLLYLGPWQWHLVYSLTRDAQQTRNGEMVRNISELIEQIFEDEIVTIGLTARWTELLER